MIIKFTRNLGNYKKGKIYVCKNDLDKTKAKELIKWGFAVEANPFAVSEEEKREAESIRGGSTTVPQAQGDSQPSTEVNIQEYKKEKAALQQKISTLEAEKRRTIELLKKNLTILKDQLKKKDQYIENKDRQIEVLNEEAEKLQVSEALKIKEIQKRAELEGKIRGLKAEIEELRKSKEETQKKLEGEIKSLKEILEKKNEQIDVLNDKVKRLTASYEKEREEKAEREERINTLEKEFEELRANKDEKISYLEELKNEKEKEATLAEKKLNAIKDQLKDKNERIESLSKEVKGLQILEVFNMKKREKELSIKDKRISELETRTTELENEKEKTLSIFKDNLSDLEDQLGKKDAQIERSDKQIIALNNEIKRIKSTGELRLEHITSTAEKKETLSQEERKRLQQKIENIRNEKDKDLELFKNKLYAIKEELRKKNRQIEELTETIDELKAIQERKSQLKQEKQQEDQNSSRKVVTGEGENLSQSEEKVKEASKGVVIDKE